jgi:hypothetical protein
LGIWGLELSPAGAGYLALVLSAAKRTGWQSARIREPLLSLAANWTGNISREFVDFGLNAFSDKRLLIAATPVIVLLFILSVYASYYLWQHSWKQSWLFIFTRGMNQKEEKLSPVTVGAGSLIISVRSRGDLQTRPLRNRGVDWWGRGAFI